jgi:hypothetical protein
LKDLAQPVFTSPQQSVSRSRQPSLVFREKLPSIPIGKIRKTPSGTLSLWGSLDYAILGGAGVQSKLKL